MLKKIQTTIVFIFLLIASFNASSTYRTYQRLRAHPVLTADPGFEFSDLAPFLADQPTIGYFTDLDFSSESLTTKNFLAAQYKLAPVALEVDNSRPPLILIDASSPEAAFKLMKRLGAEPVYLNPYGKLLAHKP